MSSTTDKIKGMANEAAGECLERGIPDFYESNPEAVGISPNRGRAHSKSMRFKSSISSDNVPSAVTRP